MSLKGAIVRARQNGHPERMGLAFEAINFPEMEEGVHLFKQLLPWLREQYPGRVVSWRLQYGQGLPGLGADRTGQAMALEAEAVMQMYRDLDIKAKIALSLEENPVLPDATEVVPTDNGFELIEGWKVYWLERLMDRDNSGMVRLKFRLQTNREIWGSPRVELKASAWLISNRGELSCLADINDDKVWAGGLERGLARLVVKNIVPAIEPQKDKEIYWFNNP